MKKKTIGKLIGLVFGFIIGIYWFLTTESYFLLFLPIIVCYLIGYVIGVEFDNPV